MYSIYTLKCSRACNVASVASHRRIESTGMNERSCPTCDGIEFDLDDDTGALTCTICGELLDSMFVSQEVEEDYSQTSFFRSTWNSQKSSQEMVHASQSSVDQTSGGTTATSRPEVRGKKRTLVRDAIESPMAYLLGMQWVLDKQMRSLSEECGVGEKVSDTAFQIWDAYVQACAIAKMDIVDAFLGFRFRKESNLNRRLAREYMGAVGSSEEDKVKELLPEIYACGTASVDSKPSARLSNTVPVPSMLLTLAINYLACLYWREPILVTDLEKWADNGVLPYWDVFSIMPNEMQSILLEAERFFKPTHQRSPKDRWTLKPGRSMSENHLVCVRAAQLAKAIGMQIPSPNFPLLGYRMSYILNLPPFIPEIVALTWGVLEATDNLHLFIMSYIWDKKACRHRALTMTLACLMTLAMTRCNKSAMGDFLKQLPHNETQRRQSLMTQRDEALDSVDPDCLRDHFVSPTAGRYFPRTIEDVSCMPESSVEEFLMHIQKEEDKRKGAIIPNIGAKKKKEMNEREGLEHLLSRLGKARAKSAARESETRDRKAAAASPVSAEVVGSAPNKSVESVKTKARKETKRRPKATFVNRSKHSLASALYILLDYIGAAFGESATSLMPLYKRMSNMHGRRKKDVVWTVMEAAKVTIGLAKHTDWRDWGKDREIEEDAGDDLAVEQTLLSSSGSVPFPEVSDDESSSGSEVSDDERETY